MMVGSIRAVDDARGEAEEFPVYQATVLAEPLTSEVAELTANRRRATAAGLRRSLCLLRW